MGGRGFKPTNQGKYNIFFLHPSHFFLHSHPTLPAERFASKPCRTSLIQCLLLPQKTNW